MINPELMDEKIEKLEKLIIPNKGPMDNLAGDIGTEKIETFKQLQDTVKILRE